jgi:hypothetical protein
VAFFHVLKPVTVKEVSLFPVPYDKRQTKQNARSHVVLYSSHEYMEYHCRQKCRWSTVGNFEPGWYGPKKINFLAISGPPQGSRSLDDVKHVGDIELVGDEGVADGGGEDVDIVNDANAREQVGDVGYMDDDVAEHADGNEHVVVVVVVDDDDEYVDIVKDPDAL